MTKLPYQLTGIPVDGDFTTSPADWIVAQARKFGLRYLLAHADDGVIWGRIDDDGLHISHDIAPASAAVSRASTLQQARNIWSARRSAALARRWLESSLCR